MKSSREGPACGCYTNDERDHSSANEWGCSSTSGQGGVLGSFELHTRLVWRTLGARVQRRQWIELLTVGAWSPSEIVAPSVSGVAARSTSEVVAPSANEGAAPPVGVVAARSTSAIATPQTIEVLAPSVSGVDTRSTGEVVAPSASEDAAPSVSKVAARSTSENTALCTSRLAAPFVNGTAGRSTGEVIASSASEGAAPPGQWARSRHGRRARFPLNGRAGSKLGQRAVLLTVDERSRSGCERRCVSAGGQVAARSLVEIATP